jgi:hypothetical protein
MIRKSLCLLAVTTLVLFANASLAHGQVAVYGTVTLKDLGGIQSSPVLSYVSSSTSSTTIATTYHNTVDPLGFTGGAYYDFKNIGPIRLGVDLRGSIVSTKRGAQTNFQGPGSHIYSGLGGVRAVFPSPIKIVKPYAQLSGGYARSNYGVLTNAQTTTTVFPGIPTQSSLEYHVFAGADIHILPIADFRIVELGFGGLESFGNYAHNYPIRSISSGFVLHFPRP